MVERFILNSATTRVRLMISINDDDDDEPREEFSIALTSFSDICRITSSPVPVYIMDNDGKYYYKLNA